MFNIENLLVEIDGKPILKGLSPSVNAGEVHAGLGPNGAGKSMLGGGAMSSGMASHAAAAPIAGNQPMSPA